MAAGADVYSTGPQGETVLAEVVHSGNIEFVTHLLEQGYIIQYAPSVDGEEESQQQGERQIVILTVIYSYSEYILITKEKGFYEENSHIFICVCGSLSV